MSTYIRITKGRPRLMTPEKIPMKMTPNCILHDKLRDIVVYNHMKTKFYIQIYEDK